MGIENTKCIAQPRSAYRFDFHYSDVATAKRALGYGLDQLFRLRPGLWIGTALNEVRRGCSLRITIIGPASNAILVKLVF